MNALEQAGTCSNPLHVCAGKGEEMKKESNERNGLEHVPACSNWPPPWLTPGPANENSAGARLPEPPADVSPWDLPPDLYERWEERVCIMHYDGGLPWPEAEKFALADVLRQVAPNEEAAAKPIGGNANETSSVQGKLFGAESGPYGREA